MVPFASDLSHIKGCSSHSSIELNRGVLLSCMSAVLLFKWRGRDPADGSTLQSKQSVFRLQPRRTIGLVLTNWFDSIAEVEIVYPG